MIPYNQLSLADIFSDCQKIYESDKPQFLSLLQQHIDFDEWFLFSETFLCINGRTRKYPLNAFFFMALSFSVFFQSLLIPFALCFPSVFLTSS